ncbi:hypothetical protein D9758_009220 [Tetrapyrgos nigripes]|uniref:DUF6535 domain-containing protein n=1 Tax=Tetrapyrgos nigripes TaxID=182062 RepID=A0A8H5FWC0_9AGAR|nr:hypothetical protein D9758_009220 [Tetrapyrgos nigripes]
MLFILETVSYASKVLQAGFQARRSDLEPSFKDSWDEAPEERAELKKLCRPTVDEEACNKLWNVYIDEASRYDETLLQGWKQDMDGILLFSALYSASLTAFIIESYKMLQPDPVQDAVAFLSQIAQHLSSTLNGTSSETTIDQLPPFQPPLSSIVCNVFWFLSLALALTCSLLATFVQQWIRDFIHKTHLKPSPVRRARVIAFMYFGLRSFGMHTFVDVIPILLHISLCFFFAGLVGFLLPVNVILTYIVTFVLVAFLVVYLMLTILPLLYLDAPYRTPLSNLLWSAGNAMGMFLSRRHHFGRGEQTLTEAMLEKPLQDTMARDQKAMIYTMKSLSDDSELLPFIEAIPDAIYDPRTRDRLGYTHGVRTTNGSLLSAILLSSDPEVNILSRITQFIWRSESWTEVSFRERSSLACPQALWSLAWMLVQTPRQQLHRDITSIPLHCRHILETLSSLRDRSISGQYKYSAIAAMRVNWMQSTQYLIRQFQSSLSQHTEITGQARLFAATSLRIWHSMMLVRDTNTTTSYHPMSPPPETETHLPLYYPMNCPPSITTLCYSLCAHFERLASKPLIHLCPSTWLSETRATLSKLDSVATWKPLRLYILSIYLLDSVNMVLQGTMPYEFELMCRNIYPGDETPFQLEEDDLASINTTGPLTALRRYLNLGQVSVNDLTLRLLVQSMGLFSSGEAAWDTEAAASARLAVEEYICRMEEADFEHLGDQDLRQVWDYILKDLQDGARDPVSCLQAAWLLVTRFQFRPNYPPPYTARSVCSKLSTALRKAPVSLQQCDMYPVLKTLVDGIMCRYFIPRKMLDVMVREYLHQEPNTSRRVDSTCIVNSLMVSITARFMNLIREPRGIPNHLRALQTLSSASVFEKVNQSSQIRFAQSISRLVQSIYAGLWSNEEPDSVSAILQLVWSAHQYSSDSLMGNWGWLTSRRGAKILANAIDVPQRSGYSLVMEGQDKLLARCRCILLTHQRTRYARNRTWCRKQIAFVKLDQKVNKLLKQHRLLGVPGSLAAFWKGLIFYSNEEDVLQDTRPLLNRSSMSEQSRQSPSVNALSVNLFSAGSSSQNLSDAAPVSESSYLRPYNFSGNRMV